MSKSSARSGRAGIERSGPPPHFDRPKQPMKGVNKAHRKAPKLRPPGPLLGRGRGEAISEDFQ